MCHPRKMSRAPGRRRPRPHVWVCAFEHRHGLDVWACASELLAYGELARVCREFWDEALELDGSPLATDECPALPAEPPADDRAAVELYFEVMGQGDPPESFLIAAHEVVGAEGGDRR